ncbi:MAG: sulfite reductase subunit alpha [Proteobacteria bacterium]|nr:sulfite reductase subunit alpha [Pseudomonadota bacterium]MBI3500142.1 sulfite reductase subunit alpha [Pseudomonadota bacterium]
MPLIPESAPFTTTQRAWLNGFFAGLLSGEVLPAQPSQPDAEEFPWHDPTLAIAERLALAEGKPPARMLMAAMAQLDCGQCGYLCQSYGEALAAGSEKNLGLCAPGGRETQRMLRKLIGEAVPAGPGPVVSAAPTATAAPIRFEWTRRLNHEASAKDTRHVVLHLNGSALDYEVGDSLGLFAANCPELVADTVAAIGVAPCAEVDCPDGVRRPLIEALASAFDIARPSDAVIELMKAYASEPEEARGLARLAEGLEPASIEDPDLLDLLRAFPSARPPLTELTSALTPLRPRLYSIASSPKAHAGEVHLTVAVVRYQRNGRRRKGVASTYLAERAIGGGELGAYVQPSHGFRLPADPATPIIMIGPGTGVAPFRAFLQERRAVGASGRNWLLFGDQHSALDFLYREEIEAWRRDGLLTSLDTAFSRDQPKKLYVQHRMSESATALWAWLEEGAHVYVCGDAKRMARDVDRALGAIVASQGGMSEEKAKSFLAGLVRDKRYQRDVY